MRYITSVERIGMEQGIQQGLQQGQAELVLRLLARRFGAVPPHLEEQVRATPSAQMLALQDIALDAGSLDEVAAAVEAMTADAGNGSRTARP